MNAETRLDNPIVKKWSGVDWTTQESDELAKEAISEMLEGLDHPNGGVPTDVPMPAFRRSGLLGMLSLKFEGDIPRALRFARPDLFHKPLLHLEDFRPGDPLFDQWKEEENETISRIRSSMVSRETEFYYLFEGRRIPDREAQRLKQFPETKRRVKERSLGKHLVRMYPEDWWEQDNREMRVTINNLVRPGDAVCSFLTGHDAVIPSLLASRTGNEGKVYIVTPGHLRYGLSEAFFNLYANLSQIKGERNIRTTKHEREARSLDRKLTGSDLIGTKFRERIREYLHSVLGSSEEAFYLVGLDWRNIGIMERLFEDLSISPLHYSPPNFPREIPERSVDVVLESDGFQLISEEKKEEVLQEIDRILKPGGLLLVRESATQQTAIQYYGQELFEEKYLRWQSPDQVKHWSRWLIWSKQKSRRKVGTPEALVNGRKNPPTLEELISEINLAKQEQAGEGKTITLSWFKNKGFLPLLVSRFEGNIDKAIEFALGEDSYNVESSDIIGDSISEIHNEPEESHAIRVPKGAKEIYGIDDLVEELNVSRSQLNKAIRHLGIKVLGAPTGTRGGFTTRAVKSREYSFSYQEYVVVRDALKRQNLKQRTTQKKESSENG